MIDGYVLATPLLLLLLLGMLRRFIGCSSFSAGGVPDDTTPSPDNLPTGTTLTGSPNPSSVGQAVSFSVAVKVLGGGPPVGGQIDLRDGPLLLQTVPIDAGGNATILQTFPTAGTHKIDAVYSGVPAAFIPSVGTWPQVVIGPPPASIEFRHSAENSETLNNSSVSTAAFGTNVSAGNLMLVWIFWRSVGAQTLTGVTDTIGNTYQRAVGSTSGTGTLAGFRQEIWYAQNIKAGAAVKVTAAFSGAFNDEKNIAALEYANASKTAPIDKTSAGSGNGVNASIGPVTTTAPGLIFAAGVFQNNATSGAGFIQRSSLKNNAAGDKVTAAPGAVIATFTNTPQDWIAQMVTLK